MRVVVVGSGGREHGLAKVMTDQGHEVFVAPGNPGIPGSTSVTVETFLKMTDVELVVVGPEQPLTAGLADRLRANSVRVFGPGADGAMIEGSKAFMKEVVTAAGVPTAEYRPFDGPDLEAAKRYASDLLMHDGAVVIKTDYLAAGKGVLVTSDRDEALADVEDKLKGGSVVIERALSGPEVSVFAVCDGSHAICLEPSQDYKPLLDGGKGPNTGGMGAWSPLPFLEAYVQKIYGTLEESFEQIINRLFIRPTLEELRHRGIDYRGVLYAGLILTDEGPKLLEYNVRFGDPDSQVVLMRLESDLAELLAAAADGNIHAAWPPTYKPGTAVLVVGASEGYPGTPRTGDVIKGLDAARHLPGVEVLCAGVKANDDGELLTAGGRVTNVIGFGPDPYVARKCAYEGDALIEWPGKHGRTDVGLLQ